MFLISKDFIKTAGLPPINEFCSNSPLTTDPAAITEPFLITDPGRIIGFHSNYQAKYFHLYFSKKKINHCIYLAFILRICL